MTRIILCSAARTYVNVADAVLPLDNNELNPAMRIENYPSERARIWGNYKARIGDMTNDDV